MAAPPPPDPAVLIDDLVEEFLLRLPPEDPADLARAALVSRQWYHVITGPVFGRRFREFHRSAPLLGYFVNLPDSIRFVSMSSFRPPHAARRNARVIHSRHGRVLLRRYDEEDGDLADVLLSVWDPITDEEWDLPVVPLSMDDIHKDYYFWDAAMVCAVGGGCKHHHGHFKVVFTGISQERDFSCFYSSEAGSWSDPVFVSCQGHFRTGPSVLVGSALYFSSAPSNEILKYDLKTNQMSTITLQHDAPHSIDGVLIATEDGRLGAAITINSELVMFSSSEHGRWVESGVIELHTLLPDHTLCDFGDHYRPGPWVVGFAETGAGVIFLETDDGYFTIDLNSERSKKVGEILRPRSGGRIVPYVSFCTPAPGAVSTNEGLGDVVEISPDEGPGAGVVVSTDEGPGAGVVVSTDEGLAAGVCQVP